jgi:hypothetical protein
VYDSSHDFFNDFRSMCSDLWQKYQRDPRTYCLVT